LAVIAPGRIRRLNELPLRRGAYVLYWMQSAVRGTHNPALEYAVEQADALALPVLVVFGLTPAYPEGNLRHYTFLLEGLRDAERELAALGIQLAVLPVTAGNPAGPGAAAVHLAEEAALLVTDCGYLRHQRAWRQRVTATVGCSVVQVEADLVVPLEQASAKLEWAAATLRPKIRRQLQEYLLAPPPGRRPRRDSLGLRVIDRLPVSEPAELLSGLELDHGVPPVAGLPGGSTAAWKQLEQFVAAPLRLYHLQRSDPGRAVGSGLSPYLHFGHISPVTIALRIRRARGVPPEAKDAFLEELIVRRELAFNYVYFEPAYDQYHGLPDWARRTLAEHAHDPRPYLYDRAQLEAAATHDPYWNAAMREMLHTGKTHGYMRMYWGKKILEWSERPEQAFDTALYLNNRFSLDGRDANSYAGVAWCFGRHDRPWPERAVYGKVRTMTAAGLKHKFDMEAYLKRVAALVQEPPRSHSEPPSH
jgi:deoxyribodipyrimidine photo-lyase